MIKNFVIPNHHNHYTPHLITKTALAVYVIVIFLFNLLLGYAGLLVVKADVTINDLLTVHNEERLKLGLTPLRLNNSLSQSASNKGADMLFANCWSHYCPDGVSPWEYFLEQGYNYEHAGENLAEGFKKPEDVILAWMNSPTHRENILNPNFDEVGFGLIYGNYQGRSNNLLIVVHFGRQTTGTFAQGVIEVSESLSGTITIDNLVNDQILNQQYIEVEGRIRPADFMVDVFINDEAVGRVKAVGENYSYATDRNLKDGNYKIFTRIVSEVVNLKSDEINIFLDGNYPFIDKSTFVAYTLDSKSVYIEFNTSNDVARISTNVPILEINQTDINKWNILFETEILSSINNFRLTLTDSSGNVSEFDIDVNELLKHLQILFSEDNNQFRSQPLPQQFITRVFDSGVRTTFPIIFVVFLVTLFLIDFVVLAKTNMLGKVSRKSHAHLSIFLVVLITLSLGTLGSSVLDSGISI